MHTGLTARCYFFRPEVLSLTLNSYSDLVRLIFVFGVSIAAGEVLRSKFMKRVQYRRVLQLKDQIT